MMPLKGMIGSLSGLNGIIVATSIHHTQTLAPLPRSKKKSKRMNAVRNKWRKRFHKTVPQNPLIFKDPFSGAQTILIHPDQLSMFDGFMHVKMNGWVS